MKNTVIILSVFTLLAGCAGVPTVTYKKITNESKKEIADSYFLNASRIIISPVKATEKNPELTYAVNVDSVEYLDEKIGVVPTNNLLQTVKINITKVENSDRVSTIGVDTTENLKMLISTVGGLAVKVAGAVGFAPGDEQPSCTVSLDKDVVVPLLDMSKKSEEFKEYRFDNNNPKSQCIRVDYDAVPPDAIPFDSFPWDLKTSKYYYSACRNARITIKYPEGGTLVKSVRVADPRFVQSVQYPFKGAITMHSQCGVSVKTEAGSNPFSGLEAISEVLKQVDAIKAANKN